MTLTQPALLPQNLSLQTDREKRGLGGRMDGRERARDGRMKEWDKSENDGGVDREGG